MKLILSIVGCAFSLTAYSIEVNNLLFGGFTEKTPINMRQSIESTPGFITSISSHEIRKNQFERLADIFKYVPGFRVIKKDGAEFIVTYHDSNAMRLQLSINGRAQHMGALSFNVFHLIPVPVTEIERINIYRSPAAARFGGNSFSAVIDIITKTPLTARPTASLNVEGERLTEAYLTANMQTGRSSLSSAISYTKDRGYDEQKNLIGNWSDETTESETMSLMLTHRWADENSKLLTDFHYGKHNRDNFYVVTNSLPADQKVERYSFGSTYQITSDQAVHSLQFDLQNYINEEKFLSIGPKWYLWQQTAALYVQNPDYFWTLFQDNAVPSGGTPQDDAVRDMLLFRMQTDSTAFDLITAELNHDYDDVFGRFGYNSTWYINEFTKTLFGIAYEKRENFSRTFLGGRKSSDTLSQHLYTELSQGNWIISVGYNLEHLSVADKKYFISPLLGISYSVNSSNTVKFLAARSHRSPDLIYTRPDWQYLATNLSEPVDGSSTIPAPIYQPYGRVNPTSEKNTAVQLIFLQQGKFLDMEIGIYSEEKTDLFSNQYEYFRFTAENEGSVRSKGFESNISAEINANNKIQISINYGDHDAKIKYESGTFASWTGFIQHHLTLNSYLLSLKIGAVDYSYFENDLFGEAAIQKTFSNFIFGVKLIYDNNNTYEIWNHDLNTDSILYDEKRNSSEFHVGLTAKYSF